MKNPATTPPTISALFPFVGNEHLVDDVAAAGYNISVHPEMNCILIVGDTQTVSHAMAVFKGGVRA